MTEGHPLPRSWPFAQVARAEMLLAECLAVGQNSEAFGHALEGGVGPEHAEDAPAVCLAVFEAAEGACDQRAILTRSGGP